jgi:hypothetical protein
MARNKTNPDADETTEIEAIEPEPINDSAKFHALVKEKMSAGLPREDAVTVARQQIEHDKALAEKEAAETKAKTVPVAN